MLARKVLIIVICIGMVRVLYAIVRDQSLVDALGQTLIAVLIALALGSVLRYTDRNRQGEK